MDLNQLIGGSEKQEYKPWVEPKLSASPQSQDNHRQESDTAAPQPHNDVFTSDNKGIATSIDETSGYTDDGIRMKIDNNGITVFSTDGMRWNFNRCALNSDIAIEEFNGEKLYCFSTTSWLDLSVLESHIYNNNTHPRFFNEADLGPSPDDWETFFNDRERPDPQMLEFAMMESLNALDMFVSMTGTEGIWFDSESLFAFLSNVCASAVTLKQKMDAQEIAPLSPEEHRHYDSLMSLLRDTLHFFQARQGQLLSAWATESDQSYSQCITLLADIYTKASWICGESVPYSILRNLLVMCGNQPLNNTLWALGEKGLDDWISTECASSRRIIVCTNTLPDANQWLSLPQDGLLIARADDIAVLNAAVDARAGEGNYVSTPSVIRCEQSERSGIQMCHPFQDGNVYIQSPTCPNSYYNIREANWIFLAEATEALVYALHLLGATNIRVSSHPKPNNHTVSEQIPRDAAHVNKQDDNTEHSDYELVMKRVTRDRMMMSHKESPSVDGFWGTFSDLFPRWKETADRIMDNPSVLPDFILSTPPQWLQTVKTLTQTEAQIRTYLPEFKLTYSKTFIETSTELQQTELHFRITTFKPTRTLERCPSRRPNPPPHVSDDDALAPEACLNSLPKTPIADALLRAAATSGSTDDTPTTSANQDHDRAEALFLKRATRYATNDGKIDAEEYANLQEIARKYGIDDLRMEELIEDAFSS